MQRKLVAVTLLVVVALAGRVLAPEGHEHKGMGKVVASDEKTIQVESLDGKKVSGVLSAGTKYLRDKAPAERADVKLGERVVIVIVEEQGVRNVKQVLLSTAVADEHKAVEHKH